MRRLIGTVCHKSVYIRELFYYFVINIVKGNTVMYITGSGRCKIYGLCKESGVLLKYNRKKTWANL